MSTYKITLQAVDENSGNPIPGTPLPLYEEYSPEDFNRGQISQQLKAVDNNGLQFAEKTFKTTFESTAEASEWTPVSVTTGINWSIFDLNGDFVLRGRTTTTTNARRWCAWHAAHEEVAENVDITARVRVSGRNTTSTVVLGPGIFARGTINDGNQSGYMIALFSTTSQTYCRLFKYVNGTSTDISPNIPFEWDVNQWYHMRLQVMGNQIKAKIWGALLEEEPEGWLLDYTDTSISTGTCLGVSTFFSASNMDFYCNYIKVINYGRNTGQSLLEGTHISQPLDLAAYSSNPDFRAAWKRSSLLFTDYAMEYGLGSETSKAEQRLLPAGKPEKLTGQMYFNNGAYHSTSTSVSHGEVFEVHAPCVLKAVTCLPGFSGEFTLQLYKDFVFGTPVADPPYQEKNFTVTSGRVTRLEDINWVLEPGVYLMTRDPATRPFYRTSGHTFPYYSENGTISIIDGADKSTGNAVAGFWYYWYHMEFDKHENDGRWQLPNYITNRQNDLSVYVEGVPETNFVWGYGHDKRIIKFDLGYEPNVTEEVMADYTAVTLPTHWYPLEYGESFGELPEFPLVGQHLWTRKTMSRLHLFLKPLLKWFAVGEGHFTSAKFHLDGHGPIAADENGEAVFEDLTPGEYDFLGRALNSEKIAAYTEETGKVELVDEDIHIPVFFKVVGAAVEFAVKIGQLIFNTFTAIGQAFQSALTGIRVQPAFLRIEPGQSTMITANLFPVGAEDTRVSWTTNDSTVASVIGSGLRATVRAVSTGNAVIRATTVDGGFSAEVNVTVADQEVIGYESIKILHSNLTEIVSLLNTEIMDLTISRELSGHHGVEFVIPVGATGWSEIQSGRYIETEGEIYFIERVKPGRDNKGIPTVQVSCTHLFFETEKENMPVTTSARATIADHLNYILHGTDYHVVLTDAANPFYDIERVVAYTIHESRFEAVKRVFSIFGGFNRLTGFSIEVIPPRPMSAPSAVCLEYAVTNSEIEKQEDDSGIVTILHATAGDGMRRTVYAPMEVRSRYRKDRIRFVDFGDVRVWNNFVYITDQYVEKRQYPRRTYHLSVAELKRIIGIESLYPNRDFEIEIGKVVQVKDTELGIDDQKLVQRYTYKPLEPDSLSTVVVGDKPYDITFQEESREGTVGEDDGEWRYDEGTGEWIFFPNEPDYGEDDVGVDYTLTITNHPGSCGVGEIRYRYHTGSNAYETSVLTIEEGAKLTGNVTVVLDGAFYSIPLQAEDTAEEVAQKIAAVPYQGWHVHREENVLTFTAANYGTKKYSAAYHFGLTGAIGTMHTAKGREEAYTSELKKSSLPFEMTFAEGDMVEVEAISGNQWFAFAGWEGDGEGVERRLFTMTEHLTALTRFASTAGEMFVATLSPSNIGSETVRLNGFVYDTSRYATVDRGFIWSVEGYPTMSSHDGMVMAGSGGTGAFHGTLHRVMEEPYAKSYTYRAFVRAYNYECGREEVYVHGGRSVRFRDPALDERTVTIEVVASDGHLIEETIDIVPYLGSESVAVGTELMIHAIQPILGGRYTFSRWEIVGTDTLQSIDSTDNPLTLTVDRNYLVRLYVDRPWMTLTFLARNGTGSIQYAFSPDGVRETRRLNTQLAMLTKDVYVWVVPDSNVSGTFEWEGTGEGSQPRHFAVTDSHPEAVFVDFSPRPRCETRCIFISPDDPDPDIGVDGNIWLKYRE